MNGTDALDREPLAGHPMARQCTAEFVQANEQGTRSRLDAAERMAATFR